jgi:hypothetical protein
MVRNRILSQESRDKKRAYLQILEKTTLELSQENEMLNKQNNEFRQRMLELENENKRLLSLVAEFQQESTIPQPFNNAALNLNGLEVESLETFSTTACASPLPSDPKFKISPTLLPPSMPKVFERAAQNTVPSCAGAQSTDHNILNERESSNNSSSSLEIVTDPMLPGSRSLSPATITLVQTDLRPSLDSFSPTWFTHLRFASEECTDSSFCSLPSFSGPAVPGKLVCKINSQQWRLAQLNWIHMNWLSFAMPLLWIVECFRANMYTPLINFLERLLVGIKMIALAIAPWNEAIEGEQSCLNEGATHARSPCTSPRHVSHLGPIALQESTAVWMSSISVLFSWTNSICAWANPIYGWPP